MATNSIEEELLFGRRHVNPIATCNPNPNAGYYAIWLTKGSLLPQPFMDELQKRNTQLLYIGLASKSLLKRLLHQELQHKNPATFFRSIGAVLGFRPAKGSLAGKRNQNNYKFTKNDTDYITKWIDKNLEVSFVECDLIDCLEESLIAKYSPILNWTHSKDKFEPLRKCKDECRLIARE